MSDTIQLSKQSVNSIWSALKEPVRRSMSGRAEFYFKKIAKSGWAFYSDIEEILEALDHRVPKGLKFIRELTEAVDIHWERICLRPSFIPSDHSIYEAIRAEQLVNLLCNFQRMGFNIDPLRFSDLLLPGIKANRNRYFTWGEVGVLWLKRHQHKLDQLVLIYPDAVASDVGSLTTNGGYRVDAELDENGEAFQLNAHAPHYKKVREPEFVRCADCGFEWHKGERSSDAMHRKQHKITMLYLNPTPHDKMRSERVINDEPELVTHLSPLWKHQEMYFRARAFRREMNYDFTQWGADRDDDPNVHGYLFTDDSGSIVGACAFRDRAKEKEGHKWALQWVWLCPGDRRAGHLSKRWKALRSRFGDFVVESPVSEAMLVFLKKQGDEKLIDYAVIDEL